MTSQDEFHLIFEFKKERFTRLFKKQDSMMSVLLGLLTIQHRLERALQDARNLTLHAPAGSVAGSETAKEDENDRPEARIPGCTCYAHQWGWHASSCPLYDESLLPGYANE